MPSYQQYNQHDELVTPEDLQNKKAWCKEGERIEEAFVKKYGDQLGVGINPEKTSNPYAPDLISLEKRTLLDLKTQNTPFFKAGKLYEIDPGYAVVFNRKDLERYAKLYAQIDILFWIEWHAVKFVMGSYANTVDYLNGVWEIPFRTLYELCRKAPEHSYLQRKHDKKGNAKSSFVLDIRNPAFLRRV